MLIVYQKYCKSDNMMVRDFDLSYFFLNNRDKVVKNFGSGYFELFLIEKSLFDYYMETKNIFWIFWFYVFVLTFNLFDNPIKPNPNDANNPLLDIVFLYANGFLYVQKWLINKTKEDVINSINSHFDVIYQRLDYWKQQDSNNTYCSLEGYAYCSGKDCSLHDTHHCVLHHYITAWDNLKSDIKQQQQQIINDINSYFDWLLTQTEELFKLRLFWTFILCVFFVKLPFLAIRLLPQPKKTKLSKINKALLIIVANKNKPKEIIKEKIRRKLRVSDNAVNIYLSRLKEYGYIWYDKNSDKIELRKLAFKKVNYLIDKYDITLWEYR